METKQLSSGLLVLTGLSVCVLTFGALFRFLHFPGGGKILFAGSVAMVITCLWWMASVKNLPLHEKFVSTKGTEEGKPWHFLYLSVIILPASIATVCAGIALRLMQFPGSYTVIMVGAMTVAIMALYIPFFYIKARKNSEQD